VFIVLFVISFILGRRGPHPGLGPLYLLADGSGNGWLGLLLLAALTPCLLAFPVWPARRTALLAALAAAVWVILGWCIASNLRP
jgi:hypothetical protein